jgi:hypothetical protein
MENLTYSLYFGLIWFCFLLFVIFDNRKEILKNRISFDGFWIVLFLPTIIAILIEYLFIR